MTDRYTLYVSIEIYDFDNALRDIMSNGGERHTTFRPTSALWSYRAISQTHRQTHNQTDTHKAA